MTDRDLLVHPLQGYPSELAAALWMMEDTRARTMRALDGLPADHVDARPTGADNTIGSLLYHLAAIEADWLYADILQKDYPEWMAQLFPADVRTDEGQLTPIGAASLHEHLGRLATVRRHFLEDLADLTADDFRRPRKTESGLTTPEWVLHHLRQHEAEHRGQIQAIRKGLEVLT
ncbi:MAG TPA: DinB family protein [Acidimicrobiia bacterium]